MSDNMRPGDVIKRWRLELGAGLRQFCLDANIDAGEWCDFENGRVVADVCGSNLIEEELPWAVIRIKNAPAQKKVELIKGAEVWAYLSFPSTLVMICVGDEALVKDLLSGAGQAEGGLPAFHPEAAEDFLRGGD